MSAYNVTFDKIPLDGRRPSQYIHLANMPAKKPCRKSIIGVPP
jgi:hypothetical protein